MKEKDAFYPIKSKSSCLSEDQKIEKIQAHFKEIMETLGLDLSNDSLCDTPKRVAKMYVKELFWGLNLNRKPKHSTFKNRCNYNQMLVEKNIKIYSTCEHHFLPIVGKAQVAYISSGKVIGLSKINRIVDYCAKRPQTQEKLTIQIVKIMEEDLGTKDIACFIDAKHLCVNSRGVSDVDSSTITYELRGKFKEDPKIKEEFFAHLQINTKFGI